MKCFGLVVSFAATFIASSTHFSQQQPVIAAAIVAPRQQLEAEAMANRSGCFECHGVDKKVIGPAYRDIAAKYKNDPRARLVLIEKVKKGGKGNWTEITGGVPMPPFSPRLSSADIERLVDWILAQ